MTQAEAQVPVTVPPVSSGTVRASHTHKSGTRRRLERLLADAAVRVALLTSGLGAVVGSVIAGIALGPHDPLTTVWEHQDERQSGGTAPTKAPQMGGLGPSESRVRPAI